MLSETLCLTLKDCKWGYLVFQRKRLEPRVLPWQPYSRCHSVSFGMYVSGTKFEEHCSNISQEIFLIECYLRNRKHVPCFYQVIQTRVEVWENEKCCGNTSRRQVFPRLFRVLPNFYECLYNSIETRYMFSIAFRK